MKLKYQDENRFWSKVDKGDGCWEWTAGKLKGYGLFWLGGSMKRAHRVSWVIKNGEIADDLHVLHKCNNCSCVNPDHLYLGTDQDNANDRKANPDDKYLNNYLHDKRNSKGEFSK